MLGLHAITLVRAHVRTRLSYVLSSSATKSSDTNRPSLVAVLLDNELADFECTIDDVAGTGVCDPPDGHCVRAVLILTRARTCSLTHQSNIVADRQRSRNSGAESNESQRRHLRTRNMTQALCSSVLCAHRRPLFLLQRRRRLSIARALCCNAVSERGRQIALARSRCCRHATRHRRRRYLALHSHRMQRIERGGEAALVNPPDAGIKQLKENCTVRTRVSAADTAHRRESLRTEQRVVWLPRRLAEHRDQRDELAQRHATRHRSVDVLCARCRRHHQTPTEYAIAL
jgi:hypothetical protein